MLISANKFPREAKLTAVRGSVLVGSAGRRRMEAWSKDKWYKAKVIAVNGNQSKVHYVGYDSSTDECRSRRTTFDRISRRSLRWARRSMPMPATTVAGIRPRRCSLDGLHLIHYDKYDSTWDEWVGPA